MTRAILFVAALTLALPVSAEVWKDWTPSKEVWSVSFVKVKPNKLDDYLKGLKQTWQSACDENKKVGQVMDCFIYASTTMNSDNFNVMLVQKHPNLAALDPDQQRYETVQKALRAKLAQDKQDKLVESYEDMRSFVSQQNFRRVELK